MSSVAPEAADPATPEIKPRTTAESLDLDGAHEKLYLRAVRNVISTEVAEFTFAQIYDGFPIYSVKLDT